MAAVEREIARLQARSARLIAAIVDDPCTDAVAPGLEKDAVREELRALLGESANSVNTRICVAQELLTRLPRTLAALETGGLTARHARQLCDAVTGLSDADAAAVEAACVPFAAGRDYTAFARKIRREVLALNPASLEEQIARALADRKVWCSPDPASHGAMAFVSALVPADGGQLLMRALDLATDHCPTDDPRTRDQRRADALVQLGVDALNGYHHCPTCTPCTPDTAACEPGGVVGNDNPERAGIAWPRWRHTRPTIQVSIAASTLLGFDDQPGHLDGHGPIPATLARHLADDPTGTWHRLITDPAGQLLDYGRTRYRPPTALRNHVTARDRTCRFPTCHRNATTCDIDHRLAWDDGGTTDKTNLESLCPRHHHIKHETGWRIEPLDANRYRWTSPTGRDYLDQPDPYPIDHTPDVVAADDKPAPQAA